MVAHTFNPTMRKAKAEGALISRPPWSTRASLVYKTRVSSSIQGHTQKEVSAEPLPHGQALSNLLFGSHFSCGHIWLLSLTLSLACVGSREETPLRN